MRSSKSLAQDQAVVSIYIVSLQTAFEPYHSYKDPADKKIPMWLRRDKLRASGAVSGGTVSCPICDWFTAPCRVCEMFKKVGPENKKCDIAAQ